MVSEYRFIPTGYLGTEQAAVLLAELVAPANWQDETFLPGEHVLWNELGRKLSAEFIELSLIELRERAKERNLDFSPMRTRWVDFDVAMRQLLKSLFAGEITAKCCDPDGERELRSIKKDFWGGVHGVDSLLRGLVQTTYPRAVILIEESAVRSLAKLIARSDPSSSKPKMPKLSRAAEERTFKEWRDACAENIPTQDEDIGHMRQLGVSRDRVIELRKKHPSLPRGKPKAK